MSFFDHLDEDQHKKERRPNHSNVKHVYFPVWRQTLGMTGRFKSHVMSAITWLQLLKMKQ